MKVKDHIDKASHNESFVESLDANFEDEFTDWKITALFYSSVHYLSAYIAYRRTPVPSNHKKRAALLDPEGENKLDMEYIPYDAYLELQEYAHKTRYMNHYAGRVSTIILKKDLEQSKENLTYIKEFIIKQGLKL